MDTSLITEEKSKYIVDNTILECNRVLEIWSRNGRSISYNQKESLFTNYLSKFFRDKYGSLIYNKQIRRCDFSVVVSDNKIYNVSMGSWNSTNVFVSSIKTELDKLNKKHPWQSLYPVVDDVKNIINYNKIINIKF